MAKGTHDWPAIRREYEEGPLTVAAIAAKRGVPDRSIYDHARKEDWRRRRAGRSKPASKAGKLLGRLTKAVSSRLDELEAAGTGPERGAAERERDTRSLAALVKLSEKIVDLERKARERTGGTVEWTQEYRDRQREELAQRVCRMLEQIRGEPLPDGP